MFDMRPLNGVPTVRVLLHDLIAALEGRTMRVTDDTGRQVDLRLFKPEEFIIEQHAVVDSVRPGNESAKIDLARARDLTQPLRITGAEPA